MIELVQNHNETEKPIGPPECSEMGMQQLMLDRWEGCGEVEEKGSSRFLRGCVERHGLIYIYEVGEHRSPRDEPPLRWGDSGGDKRLNEKSHSTGQQPVVRVRDIQGPDGIGVIKDRAVFQSAAGLLRKEKQEACVEIRVLLCHPFGTSFGCHVLERVEQGRHGERA